MINNDLLQQKEIKVNYKISMLSSSFILRFNMISTGSVGRKILKFSISLRSNMSTSITEIERKFPCTPDILQYCKSNAVSSREISMSDVYFDNQSFGLTTRDMWLRQRNNTLELKSPMSSTVINNSDNEETLVGLDFYKESTDLLEIANILHSTADVTVKFNENTTNMDEVISSLSAAGVVPFGTFITKRTRYSLRVKLPPAAEWMQASPPIPAQQTHVNMFVDIDIVKYILPDQSKDSDSSIQGTGTIQEHSEALAYEIGEIELATPSGTTTTPTGSTTTTAVDKEYNNAIMSHIFQVIGIHPAPVRGKVLEYIARFRPQHYEALRQSGQLASKGL